MDILVLVLIVIGIVVLFVHAIGLILAKVGWEIIENVGKPICERLDRMNDLLEERNKNEKNH